MRVLFDAAEQGRKAGAAADGDNAQWCRHGRRS
jgi:hypothetical protein